MNKIRVLTSPAFWVIVVVGCLAVFANLGAQSGLHSNAVMGGERPSLSQMAKEESVLREGAVLADVKGRFKKQGERFVFTDEATNKSYKCLENLCLQRLTANQMDDDRKVIWMISAKMTEFNNENFLILEKSVRTR